MDNQKVDFNELIIDEEKLCEVSGGKLSSTAAIFGMAIAGVAMAAMAVVGGILLCKAVYNYVNKPAPISSIELALRPEPDGGPEPGEPDREAFAAGKGLRHAGEYFYDFMGNLYDNQRKSMYAQNTDESGKPTGSYIRLTLLELERVKHNMITPVEKPPADAPVRFSSQKNIIFEYFVGGDPMPL